MTSTSGIGSPVDHAAIRPRRATSTPPRRTCSRRSTRRAGCCRPTCRPRRPTAKPIRPTAPVLIYAVSFRRAADLQGRRLRLHHPRAKAVDGAGRVRGAHLRPAALCGAYPDQSRSAGAARHRFRGCAQRAGRDDARPAQGQPRRRPPDLHPRHQRPAVQRRRLQQRHRRLPQRRAGPRQGCRQGDRFGAERPHRRLVSSISRPRVCAIQRQAGANTIAARRHDQGDDPAHPAIVPAVDPCRSGVRPLAGHPRRGARRAIHDDADRSASSSS